ncbi:cupin domain-containing protein [Pelagibius sp. CAU 1746]|uniref:cupin domain-containing protein n=1 Tax=Pelagibius sp. CAU 1746 TaxID=3140370 RepID=UPI00325B8F13
MSENPMLPALDPASLEARKGSSYPEPWGSACGAREKRRLGDALGLSAFGVNLVRLPPGALSSQRHWHSHEDEFVYVLEGEVTLITDAGAQVLTPGMAAGFPAGREDGHHLVNRGNASAVYLEVGGRSPEDSCHYPDIDLFLPAAADGNYRFTHKNGEPY